MRAGKSRSMRDPSAVAADTEEFERTNCPICDGNNHSLFLQAADRFNMAAGQSFQLVECQACGFKFLNPRPRAQFLAKFYHSAEYQPFLSAQTAQSFWDRVYAGVRRYTIASKRRKIERLKSKGRVLDIGCGTGEFLNEMQLHGWQVAGVERDQQSAEFAQRTFGLEISSKDLHQNKYLKKSLDVITFWHVLEHLYDPRETLDMTREWLKDDGIILVAVPNVVSFDARFYGSSWVALDAPRHLHHFTPQSISAMCQTVGLQVLRLAQMPLDAFYNCLMSERLIMTRSERIGWLLPLLLLKAFLVALVSTLKSTRLRAQDKRQGSSMLYFIQKGREIR